MSPPYCRPAKRNAGIAPLPTALDRRGISWHLLHLRDANNFPVAYVYFESEQGRRAAANLMTKDEARKLRVGSPSCLSC
jgi:hypothetical protein